MINGEMHSEVRIFSSFYVTVTTHVTLAGSPWWRTPSMPRRTRARRLRFVGAQSLGVPPRRAKDT